MEDFIDSIQRGDLEKVADTFGIVSEDTRSPAYVYAVRSAISMRDFQMLEYLLRAVNMDDYMFDVDTISVSAMHDIKIFEMVIGLWNQGLTLEFPVHKHPLVVASRIGNHKVAAFVVDWIRTTEAVHVKEPVVLKDFALKMAARGGHVSIANMLITKSSHANEVVATLLANGHIDQVKRFANNKFVDFSANNFELLKLCAPHPTLLHFVMRHPSLSESAYNLPTEYSQIAMMAAKLRHKTTNSAGQ